LRHLGGAGGNAAITSISHHNLMLEELISLESLSLSVVASLTLSVSEVSLPDPLNYINLFITLHNEKTKRKNKPEYNISYTARARGKYNLFSLTLTAGGD
jgi:hypothetical protein